jgi:hypothetical protein
METEQPCPYCKRVHYSSYNAEKCAARHDASSELTDYVNEQREKKQKQKPQKTGKERFTDLNDTGNLERHLDKYLNEKMIS